MARWRAWWLIAAVGVVGVGACSGDAPKGSRSRPAATHRTPARQRRARRVLPVAPTATRGRASRRAAIPILMYHVLSAASPGAAYPALWVSRRRFAGEMAVLRRAGYHAITLAAAVRGWRRGGPLPRRPVVISFDDGYRSDFTHARPVLRRLGWPGVLNLVLHNLGPRGITAGEVRQLIASGWEIDSHTLTHRDLTTLPAPELRHELIGSRAAIRHRFGQPADFFCYPAGRYDARVVAAVRAAGYRAATTVDEGYGVAGERYVLKRIRVEPTDSPASLLARLRAERPIATVLTAGR